MDKTINTKNNTIKKPPPEIIKAAQLIESWAAKQTDRDDWAIGGIACRAGFERLLKLYNKIK